MALILPDLDPGAVWLAGAGPGDPGLLTLLALQGLRQADTVVYDALVSREILALAAPGAALEYAGKRGGGERRPQESISHRLVELARQGRRVLRLKGGDPCVFGRGGEEAAALADAGVPFRLVPGVTAGVGGLAYAGIPATHRDFNHSVTLVTGHDSTGETHDALDWAALSRTSHVLVIYMALRHLASIADALMAAGRAHSEPVAVVCEASTPRQRTLVSTLGRVAAEAGDLEPPAVVVVGGVVGLREKLAWFEEAAAPLRAAR